jgi:hypothetical protein
MMNEQILMMSGDADGELEAYQAADKDSIEAMGSTIIDCGTVHCTGLGCTIP